MKKLLGALLISFLLLTGAAWAAPVNINTADAATLAAGIKGVGDKKAQAIVKYRKEHGPFRSVDELANVPGIGDKTVANNRANLTVGKGGSEAAPAAKPTSPTEMKERH